MNVTFCGSRKLAKPEEVTNWLNSILPALIEGGAKNFYLGNYGDFDYLAAMAVKLQKTIYKDINSILVLAYVDRKYEAELYDKVFNPLLGKKPTHMAIIKCNQFMVCQSDVVVSGVIRNRDSSAKTLAYAKGKEKVILQYPLSSEI